MSEIKDLDIPGPILEQLRCALCKGYLSCAPVQVLPDGRSICGRCCASTDDGPTYRQLTLEAVLTSVLFPCRFKRYGCDKLLPFGQTTVHETACDFRPVPCPLMPQGTCAWEGSVPQIPKHITSTHGDLIVEKAKCQFEINEDKRDISAVVVGNATFIVKFLYDSTMSTLRYHVQYFQANLQNASYKIRLVNDLDRDYSSTLGGSKCVPCNMQIYETQDLEFVNVADFTKVLNNPACIAVEIDLMVENLVKKPEARTNSCRWPKCTFVAKPDDLHMQKHEMTCEHCLYECPFSKCNGAAFRHDAAGEHLVKHNGQYFFKELVYKTWFKTSYGNQNFFTLSHGRVVLFCHLNTKKSNGQQRHEMVFKTGPAENLPKVVGKIHFEHSHCKIRSQRFALFPPARLQINLSDLPRCFKPDEQLTATLKIDGV